MTSGVDAATRVLAWAIGVAAVSVGCALLGGPACGGGSAPALRPVASSPVCPTLGALRPSPNGLFRVDDPKLRATVAGSLGHGIELSFLYLGATTRQARLRSGRERRQLGLELLARDTCNLIYVMWRLEPVPELVVSVKQNQGQSTHAQCENRGYRALRPAFSAPVPTLTPGTEHRLRAELSDGELSVQLDGSTVWRGPLDAGASELAGRSGLRSDNVRFEVRELRADVQGAERTCDAAAR